MSEAWRAPRWLVGGGVVLLGGGYAALASGQAGGALVAGGRVAFYAGLASLLTGVAVWLRQSPAAGPADEADEAGPHPGDGLGAGA
jgi:hypothetical protein